MFRKPTLLSAKRENRVLTSIFADARFFLMTLFSEYCSVAMIAFKRDNKAQKSRRERLARGEYTCDKKRCR